MAILQARQTVTIDEKKDRTRFKNTDHFGGELKYFSDCILNDIHPEPDAEEGYADVRVLESILEALKTGSPVKLSPFTRTRRIDTSAQKMQSNRTTASLTIKCRVSFVSSVCPNTSALHSQSLAMPSTFASHDCKADGLMSTRWRQTISLLRRKLARLSVTLRSAPCSFECQSDWFPVAVLDTWTLAGIARHSSINRSARYVHPSHDAVRHVFSKMAFATRLEDGDDETLQGANDTDPLSSRYTGENFGFQRSLSG
jgi:hypothetical protein